MRLMVLEGGADLAFERIDLVVHLIDAERRIDAAMIIDDEAGRRSTHAHIVDVEQGALVMRLLHKGVFDFGRDGCVSVAARQMPRLQRLDMALDFDIGAEFAPDLVLKARGDLMRVRRAACGRQPRRRS